MKTVSVNRHARKEVSEIIAYLDKKAGEKTGDAFFAELMTALEALRQDYGRHHFYRGDLRRVNLKQFPYHVLYRVHLTVVRVLVIRHHHRHPDHGIRRR